MILCSICARGGSKGVKNKNLRVVAGKPLIAHTIDQAKVSGIFKYITVSSDSSEILEAAKAAGADFVIERPDEMATDKAAKLPVIQHCAQEVEKLTGESFDYFFDLDATSPLRLPKDISACLNMLVEGSADNIITASPSRRSPYFNMVERTEGDKVQLAKQIPDQVVRRQDCPETFDMNASIYAWRRSSFFDCETVITRNTELYVMPEERSHDIDSELDFKIVQFMMENSLNE